MRRLSPGRWPVRWRIALVSAALTMVILVAFAFVVGRLAGDRLREDFRDQLRAAAGELAFSIQVSGRPGLSPDLRAPDLDQVAMADKAQVRIVDANGNVLAETQRSPQLGPPVAGVGRVGAYQVATAPVLADRLGLPGVFVQYARERSDVEATIDRLWLFLGGGVLAGTVLAAIAGLTVAGRAMRPISSLTAAAREVSSTRDPSRRIPSPETDDEVAELARTLDGMLLSLDSARAETQQAMDTQREFVADASHELRTPLTSILANLELLQASLERGGTPEEDADAVGSALRSSQRMGRLIGDLLLLARADAGRVGERRDCDLAEIATAALAEVAPVSNSHPLSHDTESVRVEGNPDELHRLVANLLENALRHTPAGTPVELRVRAQNGTGIVEVTDDGPGVPPELREQIFGRFVRGAGPADRADDPSGTGLGLAIVRAVAVSHGGDVEVAASPSGGARFTVRLPA